MGVTSEQKLSRAAAALAASLLLGACAHVLTAPPGPSCARFMTAYTPAPFGTPTVAAQPRATALEDILARKIGRRAARPAPAAGAAPGPQVSASAPLTLDVLVLSGGGEYGAYGAGFLTGLYGPGGSAGGSDPGVATALADYDFISGVSTGAIMTTYVWGAAIEARAGLDPASNPGLNDLKTLYEVTDADLFRAQSPIPAILFSNALFDPRGRLERRVHDGVARYAPILRSDTADDRVEVGAVNVVNGRFYSFDLRKMAEAAEPEGLACYSEAILASAAIPLAFPPRYMDGYPYYDGGVRFLAYFDDMLRRLRRRADRGAIMLNITVIVNGSQSANGAGTDAAAAEACDAATLPDTARACPPIANNLIGSLTGGSGPKGLAVRTVEDIMVQQLKVDAVARIYQDWKTSGEAGNFRYTYIPNSQLAHPLAAARLSGPCQAPAGATDQFDPTFMRCLFAIGRAKAAAGAWDWREFQSFEQARAREAKP